MVRIVFTGGSGKAGRWVIPYLIDKGHEVLNVDRVPFPKTDPAYDVFTLQADLTKSGEVFNALTSPYGFHEFAKDSQPANQEGRKGVPDVVIHFAAYARIMIVPDNDTFANNTLSTYNVIEAACKLGVKKIIIASSETTYGVCFSQGDTDFKEYPLEETYDVDPMDSYALSKLCGERCARTFARRYEKDGVDIYALRIGNVIEPHEYAQMFPGFLSDIMCRKRCAWSYIDARDLGNICNRCIETSGLGFQVFNATNTDSTLPIPTAQFLQEKFPDTPLIRSIPSDSYEAILSNRKIREVLGFKQEFDWKRYVGMDGKVLDVTGGHAGTEQA